MVSGKISAIAVLVVLIGVACGSDAYAQNVANGEKLFDRFCSVCHYTPDKDKNWIGPSLHGVVNRRSADYPYLAYSAVFKKLNLTWTDENLDKWLKGPEAMVPGTKMGFIGLSKPEDRADVIAYLKESSK